MARGRTIALGCIALASCRTPTQITVEVRTNVVCDADHPETSITVGTLGDGLEGKAPVTVVRSNACIGGRVGALVVVPSGGKDDEIAMRVVTGVGKSAEQCVNDHYVGGCIVARRALRFVPHESLDLPIDMSLACKDVPCDAAKTCVEGRCVSATIADPGACHAEGCAEGTLSGSGSDAGVDATTDAGPATQWAKQLGDRDPDARTYVTVDKDGNVIVSSSFRGSIDVGGPKTSKGLHDVLLTKLSKTGALLWTKQLGGVSDDIGEGIATDAAGNIVLAGSVGGDIDFGAGAIPGTGARDLFLAKYDAAGGYVTARRYDRGPPLGGAFVSLDGGGNVLVGAGVSSSFDFGSGEQTVTDNQILVAKFDSTLALTKVKVFGGAADDYVRGGAGTSTGGIVIAGSFNDTIDFGDGPHTAAGAPAFDVFVAELDDALAIRWSRAYGDAATQDAYSLAIGAGDDVTVGGFMDGAIDFGGGARTGPALFLLQLDAAGAHVSSTTFGTTSYASRIGAIATAPDGSLVFGGYLEGTTTFGGTSLTASADSLGDAFLVPPNAPIG